MSMHTDNPSYYLELLKKAAKELKGFRDREQHRKEPVAIIGMACRFPGQADHPDAFWRLLNSGTDAIAEVPRDRWDADALYHPDPEAAGKTYARHGGFLRDVRTFDPLFFGISPAEALSMDPQQRLLLEVCWEAFEDAGSFPTPGTGQATGVFVGISNNDYARVLQQGQVESASLPYFGTGNALNAAAGRISYLFGFRGPCLSIDTACSSSLVALHQACRSLRDSDCRQAIAAGVNLMLTPDSTLAVSRARMLSRDGRCKTFDASADGYGRSEGCGVLLLKRLSDARADGDRILALVAGSAVNQDGSSSGFTVPNGVAQQELIRAALADAGITADRVDYVEAHGTGTSLGDPIEAGSIGAVYGAHPHRQQPVWVGSVKTNIGHPESAAGVAGVIKTVLSLHHGVIPPHLHLQQPNPYIDWDNANFRVPGQAVAWPARAPRRAAVSSFGFSGTNAHVILQEAPARPAAAGGADRPMHLFTVAAKTPAAFRSLLAQYTGYLDDNRAAALADVCYSANTGKEHFACRAAFLAASPEALRHQLAQHRNADPARIAGSPEPRVAFWFTGQEAWHAGMGRQLYQAQPVFREVIDACDRIMAAEFGASLLAALGYGGEVPAPGNAETVAGPALFALEYALARVWQSWGVTPHVVFGRGAGAYAAACFAGAIGLADGLRLVAAGAQPAGSPLGTRPEGIRWHTPTIPVVSNLDGQLAGEGWDDPDHWHQHALAPIPFGTLGRQLAREAGTVVLEVGPAAGATPLTAETDAPRCLPGLPADGSDWHALLSALKALYESTGVPINWKAFDAPYPRQRLRLPHYPFQRQPYWPAARPVEPAQPAFSAPGASTQHVYRLAWQAADAPEAGTSPRTGAPPTWLVLADRDGTAEKLAAGLEAEGYACLRLYDGDAYGQSGPNAYTLGPERAADLSRVVEAVHRTGSAVSGLVMGWWLPGDAPSVEAGGPAPAVVSAVAGLLDCLRAVPGLAALQPARFVLLTAHAWQPDGQPGGAVLPGQRALWNACNTLTAELPRRSFERYDLSARPGTAEVRRLVRLLTTAGPEDQWVIRGDRQWVPRLLPAGPASRPEGANGLISSGNPGTYLITGGLGDLGLAAAGWLAARGARHVILVGRRGVTHEGQRAAVERLTRHGVTVHVATADVTADDEVRRMLEALPATLPPLRGIVHAAGVVEDALLGQADDQRLARVLMPKVAGTWWLHRHTLTAPLDFFLCFSSVASVIGTAGQAAYAAANGFMDAFMEYRRQLGLPGLSLQWGPWQIGMNARLPDAYRRMQEAIGLTPLTVEAAEAALDALAGNGARAQWLVADLAPGRLAHTPYGKLPVFEALTAAPAPGLPAAGRPDYRRLLATTAAESREAVLVSYLLEIVGEVTSLAVGDIPLTEPLAAVGVDSLMAVRLKHRFAGDLALDLDVGELMAGAGIREMAVSLLAQWEDRAAVSAPEPPAPEVSPVPGSPGIQAGQAKDLLAGLDTLEEEDIDRLLASMLNQPQ